MSITSLFRIFTKTKDADVKAGEAMSAERDHATNEAKELVTNGVAKAKAGNYRGAIRDLDLAIKLDPLDPMAFFERSKAKEAIGDERGAHRDFAEGQSVLQQLDEGLKAYDDANAAYDLDDFEVAVRNYNKVINNCPTLTCAYYYRGAAKQCLDDDIGAIADFNKSIEANASNKADAYHQRGRIKQRKLQDRDGALKDFNAAIQLNPRDADYLQSRASLSSGYDTLRDLNLAVELEPTSAHLFSSRAVKRYALQDVRGAISDLTQFVELEPTDGILTVAEAYSLRGQMYLSLHEREQALRDYDKAIKIDPSCISAHINRGIAKWTMRDLKGAVNDLTQAIAMDPANGEAYHWRGMAREDLGDSKSANADMATAKRLGYEDDVSEAA